MIIEEQDIFNYVFSPDTLDLEKKKLIEQNIDFADAIDFYKKLKINSARKPGRSIIEQIANKIPAYKRANEVRLYELNVSSEPRIIGKRLAADSESKNMISKMMTKTFADVDKEYMIKVLNYETQTKVFVFSTKNEIIKNFDIVIEPQNIKYHFEDNSQPLLIPQIINVDNIKINFND